MIAAAMPKVGKLINPKHWKVLYDFNDENLWGCTIYETDSFKPLEVRMNVKEPEINEEGFVNDNDFILSTMALFHENRHCEQLTKLSQQKTQLGQELAMAFIAATGAPIFYRENYYCMSFEVDAELYAIKETYKYMKELFSAEINESEIDDALLRYVNKKCEEPLYPLRFFGSGKYDDIKSLMDSLDKCYKKSQTT